MESFRVGLLMGCLVLAADVMIFVSHPADTFCFFVLLPFVWPLLLPWRRWLAAYAALVVPLALLALGYVDYRGRHDSFETKNVVGYGLDMGMALLMTWMGCAGVVASVIARLAWFWVRKVRSSGA
jgi:hypothetical protein